MYKAEDPGPPAFGAAGNISTLAQMKTAGWSSLLPGTGVIWKTERLWIGQGVTFDVNNDPNTGPVSASAVWQGPVRISASDGEPGAPGGAGATGPGYSSVTDLGIDGNGDRLVRFNGVNGAANATVAIPDGPQGATGPTEIYGKSGGSLADTGTSILTNTNSTSEIDTGNTTAESRTYLITGYARLSGSGSRNLRINSRPHGGASKYLLKQVYCNITTQVQDFTVSCVIITTRRYFSLGLEGTNGTLHDFGISMIRIP
jgi:hypothetical protein